MAVRRLGLALAVLLLAVIPAGGASAQGYSIESAGANKHPKLSSGLVDLARERRAHGAAAARARAADVGLDIATGGLLVQVTANDVEAAMAAISAAGGVVGERFGPNLDARVPATALHRLAAAPAVNRVARPHLMDLFAVAGEGVAASGADAWHGGGLNGSGAKVAIIDGGFAGLAGAQANGDLPTNVVTRDECGGGFNTATNHGTGVAEIVHEMAPGAQLYLICSRTPGEVQAAKNFAASQGVTVINFSAGFFTTWRGDGSGPPGTPDQTVREARGQGILWVNAAGNHAQKHWSGSFTDTDANDQHEFDASGDEGNNFLIAGGQTGCAMLRWDDWPGSDQDYDLFLFSVPPPPATPVQVASSEETQDGTQPPVEVACFTPPSTSEFAVVILKFDADQTPSPRFDLFNNGPTSDWEYFVEAGSLAEPASSPNVMTAGAICWQNDALEDYSSQGPNHAGVTKPDIAGHDSNSGFTFGPFQGQCGDDGFTGTSAASPHVAGAATLVKGVRPRTFGPNETQSFLESRARDLMSPGKDNQTGFGELQLGGLLGPEPPPPPPPAPPNIGRPTLSQVRGSCRKRGRGRRRRVTCTLRNTRAVRRFGARLNRGRRTVARLNGRGRGRSRIVIRIRGRLRRGRYVLRITLIGSANRRRVMRLRFRV
jgi:subtilisin family serine protease